MPVRLIFKRAALQAGLVTQIIVTGRTLFLLVNLGKDTVLILMQKTQMTLQGAVCAIHQMIPSSILDARTVCAGVLDTVMVEGRVVLPALPSQSARI